MLEVFERNVHCLLGLPFDAVDMDEAVRQVRGAATQRRPCFLSTPNLNWLVASLTDDAFRKTVIDSDLSIVDGMPLVWVARLLGIPIRARVTGSTLFDSLRSGSGDQLSVFFFGGPDGVAGMACRQLTLESKGLTCVGYESPGFGTIEELSTQEIIQRINASKADFLVVALGARKGQAWIEHNRARISVPVLSHLGAVVNFVAGTAKRAPVWIQNAGLEWLWRIKEEPGLSRRYLSDGLVFLRLLLTHVFPYKLFLLWHRPAQKDLNSAVINMQDAGDEIIIRLHGAWVQSNVRLLRECFSKVVLAGKNVTLDMGGVTYVDSAFVGLAMLLQGHQNQHCRHMVIASLQGPVRRILRFCCADYLYLSNA